MVKKARKRDAQSEQAELILEQLAQGVAPWAKPWQALAHQSNAKTGRKYNGGNTLYLTAVADSQGYSTPLWLTSKQAQELGGRVKGSVKELVNGVLTETQQDEWDKSWPVFWFRPDERKKKDENGHAIIDPETGEPETVVYWRKGVQFVYNVEQTTVKPKKYAKFLPEAKETHERNEEIEAFLKDAHLGSGFSLSFGGDRAFYNSRKDTVRVPKSEYFEAIEEFYSTQIHEFAHASGHKSRLGRGLANKFGSEAYAEEELVAELTAAFLGAEFQIDGKCQHVEYIGGWFKCLKKNKRLFYQAASKAKKAADYLKKAAEKGSKIHKNQKAA
jgi:antirestriction protein ArdC